jgi:DNA-binding NarL/FixJ family response regulator
MSIRILIADDHKMMRDGLRLLIEKEADMTVVAEAENGRAAVERALELRPDVVIMDIGMPDLNGIEATRQITEKLPNVRVVALSMHSDRRFIAGMLSARASGYLLKDSAFEELASAVRAVVANRTYLSPEISRTVAEDYVNRIEAGDSSAFSVLSAREREVLQLLAEGRTAKQAAACLEVSVKTVETHRQNIMNKLNVFNMPDLTKYAIREGLTSLDIRA